jgi:lipid A 3-O-deacylase PagL
VKKATPSTLQRYRERFAICAFPLGCALLALCNFIPIQSIAGDVTILSLGPRYGFSRSDPVLGKRQTESFDLVDIAATFRLPWSSPLGESPWSAETRLITSAGALFAAGNTGFIATFVPDVALTGWKGLVSLDAGVGLAFLSREKYGVQDFGGPVQFVLTGALQFHPISHAFAGFRFQHCSDAGMYGSESLGIDLYLIEVGYRF